MLLLPQQSPVLDIEERHARPRETRAPRAVRRAASHKANVFVNSKDVLVNIRHMLYTLSVCYILHVKVCVWPLRLARCYSPRRFQSVRPGVHLSESVVNHIARRIVPVPIAYIAGDWLPDCSAGLELKNGMPEAGCCMRVRFASSGSRFGARATRFRHCEEQKERSKPRCTVFPPSSRTLQSAHASRGLSSSMCGGVNRRLPIRCSSLLGVGGHQKQNPKRAAEPFGVARSPQKRTCI